MTAFEKIFAGDALSKRERVEATLAHQPVDCAAILEQLSYNPGVISLYTGKKIEGFNYTVERHWGGGPQDHRLDYAPGGPEGSRSHHNRGRLRHSERQLAILARQPAVLRPRGRGTGCWAKPESSVKRPSTPNWLAKSIAAA